MGTHPIFESDFDCLTGCSVDLLLALPHDLPDLWSETPVPRSSRSKLKFPTLTVRFDCENSLIKTLRRPSCRFLRLVHRLQRPTSRWPKPRFNGLRGHQGHQQLLRPVPAPLSFHFWISEIVNSDITCSPQSSLFIQALN